MADQRADGLPFDPVTSLDPVPELSPTDLELAAGIAAVVLAAPAVIRLEPTLATVGSRWLPNRGAVDGVQVSHRGAQVRIDVSVSTSGSISARETAIDIRERVRQFLARRGLVVGPVEVNVLHIATVAPPPAAAPPDPVETV